MIKYIAVELPSRKISKIRTERLHSLCENDNLLFLSYRYLIKIG